MKSLVLILLLLPSLSSASGNRVGNGGHVIACPRSMELLDFYESTEKLQDFGSKSYPEIVNEVLTNMDRLSPAQAKQYRRRFQNFEKEAEFKKGVRLTPVFDANYLFEPKDKKCKTEQAALRRFFTTESRVQFLIDSEIWEKLSPRSKAGLILHEIIYEHLYKLKQENSDKARILNAYLFSEKSFTVSKENYWKMIKDLKLPIYQEN